MMGCMEVGSPTTHPAGPDAVLLEIANQSAHPEAAHLLVVAQAHSAAARRDDCSFERRHEFRRLRENDADEPLHVRGSARIQLAVALGGHERIGIPILTIDRHHIGVARQNQPRLVRIAQGREQIGLLAARRRA